MYIKVRVKPGMKKEEFLEKSKNYFEISVKEKAKMNMANKRVLCILAKYFNVPINKVRIVNGHHHRSKLVSVDID